ncbi:hypothetical protein BDQ94DRAFT_147474 [Aspergillus welwitschiae]|uniref:Uncharacterized protein n=1 Tax=Aspergillus welwitschiae TaxID=1341132 RepID=A0A3F3PW46_9EURO|nr:hypothetical protein BDQ94DRAFT_147474 [Aspergillus welwitschiae]RDH31105.1 hypothetical protein BDQ94DRAFT_147474 [Aspergillus welwitschiae]
MFDLAGCFGSLVPPFRCSTVLCLIASDFIAWQRGLLLFLIVIEHCCCFFTYVTCFEVINTPVLPPALGHCHKSLRIQQPD